MEWLCCLKCHQRPTNTSRKTFYVSDCGHIVCGTCKGDGLTGKTGTSGCAECQKPQPQYKELTQNISDDPAVGLFFGDLLHWSKRAAKFYEFQAYHMKRTLCSLKGPQGQNFGLRGDSAELESLRCMKIEKLQSLRCQELNFFTGMKKQYQQIMSLIRQTKSNCYADILSGCTDNPVQVLVATAPLPLLVSTRQTDSATVQNEKIRSPLGCKLPPPPPPPPHFNTFTPSVQQQYGNTTQFSSPASYNMTAGKRLSVLPPPSGGRIGSTNLQSQKPNSTIHRYLQKHTPDIQQSQ